MNEVFHVEDCAQVMTHFSAVLMSNAFRLVNEDTDYRLILGAGNFCVN